MTPVNDLLVNLILDKYQIRLAAEPDALDSGEIGLVGEFAVQCISTNCGKAHSCQECCC